MNDTSTTAALVFLDSLGNNLPLKTAFNYKQMQDFLRREGFMYEGEMSDEALVSVAEKIGELSNGVVTVTAAATTTNKPRSPLSNIDMKIASRVVFNQCADCGEPSGERLLCASCTERIEKRANAEPEPEGLPVVSTIQLDIREGAEVTLKTGELVHVVETDGLLHVGMNNQFDVRTFTANDVHEFHNMDDTIGVDCPVCGENIYGNRCNVCGHGLEE